MRFPRGDATWDQIVDNVARLARARGAGVRRLVYIWVSNAAHDSSTAYFRAKAAAEEHVRAAGDGRCRRPSFGRRCCTARATS